MKQLYRKLTLTFTFLGLGLFGICALYLYRHDKGELSAYLEQMLDQTENNIRQGEKLLGQEPVKLVVQNIATEHNTTIFALEAHTGELIGISKNNRQELEIPGIGNGRELAAYLSSFDKASYLKINNTWNLLAVRGEEEFLLGAFCRADNIFESLFLQGVIALSFIAVFSGAMIFLIRRHLERYFFQDIRQLQEGIRQIIAGDYRVKLKSSKNPELEPLIEVIRRLKQGYIHKSERMNKIFNTISAHIAVFEWLEGGNGKFFSNNLQSMLSLEDREWEEMKENQEKFRKFIFGLRQTQDQEGLIFHKGKYLKIEAYEIEEEFVGVIFDKTEEKKETMRISSALSMAVENAAREKLTGLLNREGFEKHMEEFLQSPHSLGVLILLDLDNFKKINDSLGHPQGDKVLKIFAGALKGVFRQHDYVGRIGGDEFTVFIPNALPQGVLERKLEEIRDIPKKVLPDYQEQYGLSVSIGAALVQEDQSNYRELYEQADTALYIAKKLGKNRYYVNQEKIRCMRKVCAYCREKCPRREALMLQVDQTEEGKGTENHEKMEG